jgi:hypothetical protein
MVGRDAEIRLEIRAIRLRRPDHTLRQPGHQTEMAAAGAFAAK